MENKEKKLTPTEQAILDTIRNLNYGELTITVHDRKPVLMEVTKKVKF